MAAGDGVGKCIEEVAGHAARKALEHVVGNVIGNAGGTCRKFGRGCSRNN